MARLDKPATRIKRGDIWSVDLRPGTGWEVTKIRPAVIFSNNEINTFSPTVIIIPFSSQKYKILGPERMLVKQQESNLAEDSVLLVTQIRAIDKTRLRKKIGSFSKGKLREVEEAIKIVLDF